MKKCKTAERLADFLSGEMSGQERKLIESHLESCQFCQKILAELQEVHNFLRYRPRPLVSEKFLSDYHQSLNTRFGTESWGSSLFNRFIHFLDIFFLHPSPSLRMAEIISFVMAGIIFGWFLFSSQNQGTFEPRYVPPSMSYPIFGIDLRFLNEFLMQSEIFVLEIRNSDEAELPLKEEMNFRKKSAQKLLIETFRIHEIALAHDDLQILSFLTNMEMVLYEITNWDEKEAKLSTKAIQEVIREANLLDQINKLQARIENQTEKSDVHI